MMLLFTQYKNLIILGAFGILILMLGIQSYRINSYQAELAICESQTRLLSTAIENQNKEIQKQGQNAIDAAQESARALKDLEGISKHREGKIKQLQALVGKKDLTCEKAVNQARSLI